MNYFVISCAVSIFVAPVSMAQDAVLGERVFIKCRACHAIGGQAKIKMGAPLNNLIGRKAASVQGVTYSEAMVQKGAENLIWNAKTLDAFLRRPSSFVPRTSMTFSGLKKPEDRVAVIAYLTQFTGAGANATAAHDPVLTPEILAIQGDRDYGEYLGSACVTCHQADGSDQGLPSIVGWPKDDFVTVMHAYKTKHRENTVMQQQASVLSNDEIAALAEYFKDEN